jgi:cell division protein FtsQ
MMPDAEGLDGVTLDVVEDAAGSDIADITDDVTADGGERSVTDEAPRSTSVMGEPASTSGNDRLRKIAAVVFISVVVLGAGVVTITRSPFFAARTIEVRGASHVHRSQIIRLAAVDTRTNLFTLDAGAAERRLERDAWIADATVTKDLPSTLIIEIHERVAVAVAVSDGVPQLVADDGAFLETATPRVAMGLPSIAVANPEGGQPSDSVEPSAEAVGGAARAIAAMAPTLRRRIEGVSILSDGQLEVKLLSGASVRYGEAVDLREKAMALRALLDYAAGRGATVVSVDVRVPSAPTAVLAGGEVVAP